VSDRSLATRIAASAGLAAGALALALVAALLTPGSVGPINAGVEALSATTSGALDRLALVLPFGFAFGAGMVSAVNPCGFAMLPAYLALYLRDGMDDTSGRGGRLVRALQVGGTVTIGFVALFGVAGGVLAAGTRSVAGALPWLGFATGLLLLTVGAWSALGGTLYARVGERLAQGVGGVAGVDRAGWRGYLAFGLAYGLASLSCTLPIFLAVVGSGLTLDSAPFVASQLVLYGAGMGLVVTVLTVATALFRGALLDRSRRLSRYVGPVASALMLIAGAYIVYYWLTLGGLMRTG
jgi:cytochrome c biogenesis protein CcdA